MDALYLYVYPNYVDRFPFQIKNFFFFFTLEDLSILYTR